MKIRAVSVLVRAAEPYSGWFIHWVRQPCMQSFISNATLPFSMQQWFTSLLPFSVCSANTLSYRVPISSSTLIFKETALSQCTQTGCCTDNRARMLIRNGYKPQYPSQNSLSLASMRRGLYLQARFQVLLDSCLATSRPIKPDPF